MLRAARPGYGNPPAQAQSKYSSRLQDNLGINWMTAHPRRLDCRPASLLLLALTLVLASSLYADTGDLDRAGVLGLLEQAGAGTPQLVEISARGADLSAVDFRGANLRGVNFKGANLAAANLSNAILDVGVASRANMTGARFRDASLYGVVFIEADLSGADLSGALLVGNLGKANLHGARLENLRAGANMKNQSMGLIRLIITYARLDGAVLKNADLSVCDGRFASFAGADLEGANLTDCDLRAADFTGANLVGANFGGAKINGAVFRQIRGRDRIVGLDTAEGVAEAYFD